jgi:hypothetical protein
MDATQSTENLYREELALEEMRRAYQEFSTASDVLDQKLSTILGSASLILGLFGVLQFTPFKAGQSPIYGIGLVIAVLLYIGMITLCTNALLPRTYQLPVQVDWNALSEHILVKEPRDAMLTVLSGYVARIPHNRKLNEQKAERAKWASLSLIAIVLILVTVSVVQ